MTIFHFRAPLESLASLRDRGVVRLRFWCLGCDHSTEADIDLLFERDARKTHLLDLARRSTCRLCGARGAYVAPLWEHPKKHTGYRINLEKVRKALRDELEYVSTRLD